MKLPEKCFNFVKYFVAIGVTLTVFFNLIVTLPLTAVASQSGVVTLQPTDMQNLIFVWASGTTSIQQRAFHICQTDTISSAHCAEISTDVRGAWLDLMQVDPASLGRMGVQENLTGRTQVYRSLTAQLSALIGGNVTTLLAQSQQALQQVNATVNEANNGLGPATATHYTVWATSFTQHSLPDGLQSASGRYVALPDAYLKYANAGDLSNIPSIYQPYYVPNGTQASWAVTLSLPNGTKKVAKRSE